MPAPDAVGARRIAALVGLGAVAVAGSAVPARAQLLPQMGTSVELGDLRRTFEQAYGGPVAAAAGQPAWSFTPGIDVELNATDNAQGLGFGGIAGGTNRRRSEVVTTVTPSLAIQGASQRLTGSLYYAPQFRKFLNDSRQDSIGQNLNAQGRATILEELLYLNASAFATDQSRSGGLGQGVGSALGRQDRVQTTNVTIGPQLRHAFGDWGVAEASYTFSSLSQTGSTLRTNSPFAPAQIPGNTITNSYAAGFTSGQEFGRINFGLNAQRIDYNGPGVLKNAYRQSETLDLGYAATRSFTLLGQVGHQDLKYSGLRPIRINGAIWSVGFRWTPDPDTSITARYGYRDGGDNFSFEGNTAPTARTRVSITYSEAVVSPADELQSALGRTSIGSARVAIDTATGMPVLLTNNFAGTQGGLGRVRRVSFSAVLLRDVDNVTLSLNRDERLTLSSDVPGAPPSTSSFNGTLAWQRDLLPGLQGNAQVTVGERTGGRIRQSLMTFTTGLNWSLSDTLSARATYTYTRAESGQAAFSYDANLISLGLRKTF